MKVAILDWGVGGLGFYKLFKEAYPGSPVIYWSDAGWTPYGLVSRQALRQRVKFLAEKMADREVSCLVLACNAASTAFNQSDIRPFVLDCSRSALNVTGVIAPTVHSCRELDVDKIGVIGGRRTILSKVYRRQLVAAGYDVAQRIAQPLSARIERGDVDSPALHQELAKILAPLRGVDALVLGCTHYPAAMSAIERHLPGIQLMDPALETMKTFRQWWSPTTSSGDDEFVTSGNPEEMVRSAAAAFHLDLSKVYREDIC